MGIGTIADQRTLLVIGLGNELLADDGVGIRVVRELKRRLHSDAITFEELAVGGLQLLDYMAGFKQCILIDAVVTGTHQPGTIYRFIQTPGGESIRLSSSHHVELSQVLALGKILGADIPDSVVVYGIEAEDTTTFTEQCTNEVACSISRLIDLICADLMDYESGCSSRSILATESMPKDHRGNWEIVNY